jgi:hypothetical protein
VGQHRPPSRSPRGPCWPAPPGWALPGTGSTWAPRLVAAAGACWALLAIFPDDAALVVARRDAGDPARRGWVRYSAVTGLVVAAGYVATAVLTGRDQGGVLPGAPGGLVQRATIVTAFAWLVLLAGRLLGQAPVSRA